MVEGALARNLDEVYFNHAQIYTLRSSSWPVEQAYRLMTQKTFQHQLPASIFSCGAPILPTLPQEEQRRKLMDEITLLLRTKLFLDPIRSCMKDYVTTNIASGVLRIHYKHYFELYLTLESLDAYDRWNVLGA